MCGLGASRCEVSTSADVFSCGRTLCEYREGLASVWVPFLPGGAPVLDCNRRRISPAGTISAQPVVHLSNLDAQGSYMRGMSFSGSGLRAEDGA